MAGAPLEPGDLVQHERVNTLVSLGGDRDEIDVLVGGESPGDRERAERRRRAVDDDRARLRSSRPRDEHRLADLVDGLTDEAADHDLGSAAVLVATDSEEVGPRPWAADSRACRVRVEGRSPGPVFGNVT
jgi:hypothetical protein